MKTIILSLLFCLPMLAATKRAPTKGAESLTGKALTRTKATTATPPMPPLPPGYVAPKASAVQVDTSAMRFAPASVSNPQHGFGASFGGPESGYVGQTVVLNGRYSNWDDFGDIHLWTSFTIEHNGATTSNLIVPGATVKLTPFATEPGYATTFMLTSNSIAVPPRWYATVSRSVTVSGSDNMVFYGSVEGLDLGAGGTGATIGHRIIILPGIYLTARDIGNEVLVNFLLPAGQPLTHLETSQDLATWQVAESFPPLPTAINVMKFYPHSDAKRFFRVRQ